MRMLFVWVLGVALLGGVQPARALDRDARIIDTLGVEVSLYDDAEVMAATLWSEIAVNAPRRNWAILAGGSFGERSQDDVEDVTAWQAGVGLKYYLTWDMSFSLVGSYQQFDTGDDFDILAGTAAVQYRLVPADRPVSPFVRGQVTVADVDAPAVYFGAERESFTEVIMTAGFGCDFMMNEELAFVFEGAFSESEDASHGVDYADGWTAGFAMKYYWE